MHPCVQEWQQLYMQHSWVFERLGVVPTAVAQWEPSMPLLPLAPGKTVALNIGYVLILPAGFELAPGL